MLVGEAEHEHVGGHALTEEHTRDPARVDEFRAAKEITGHLIEHGHTRIAGLLAIMIGTILLSLSGKGH